MWSRHRYTILLLVAVNITLFAAVATYRRMTTDIPTTESSLSLSLEQLDLGEGAPDEELQGEVRLTNAGPTAAEYHVEKSCGCTGVTPDAGALQPGESVALTVKLKLKSESNTTSESTIAVQSGSQRITCRIAGRCPGPFTADPPNVDFGDMMPLATAEARSRITLNVNPKATEVSLRNLNPPRPSRPFQVEFVSLTDKEAVLDVFFPEAVPDGDHHDILRLELDNSPHVVKIPLHVKIVKAVSVAPNSLVLRPNAKTGEYRPIYVIAIRNDSKPLTGPIEIQGLEDSGLAIEDAGSLTETRRRLSVKVIDPERASARRNHLLRLQPAGMMDSCEIKVNVIPGTDVIQK